MKVYLPVLRYLVVATLVPPALAAQSTPSFDCAQTSGSVQEMICASDELAGLDRELAGVWDLALASLPESELSSTPGVYHLDVSEPVVTEEEGFPPSRTVLPLVVE